MYIKKFIGNNIDAIQEKIEIELGPNAVILLTRSLEGGLLQKLFFNEEFEVTVGIDPDDLMQYQEKHGIQPSEAEKLLLAEMASMRKTKPLFGESTTESGILVTGPLKIETTNKNVIAILGKNGSDRMKTLAKLGLLLRQAHEPAIISVGKHTDERLTEMSKLSKLFEWVHSHAPSKHELNEFIKNEEKKLFLLDTPGDSDIIELGSLFQCHVNVRTLLVLSLQLSLDQQKAMIQKYLPLKPHGLIITQFDENSSFLSFPEIAKMGVPFSYIATDKELQVANADDIEVRIVNEKLKLTTL